MNARKVEAVVDAMTKEEVAGTVEEGVEMTVDTDKDEEVATVEEEADAVVCETCIFCTC